LVGILVLVLQVVSFIVGRAAGSGRHVDAFPDRADRARSSSAIINTILTSILGVDSGGSYYGALVQRLMVNRSEGHTGQDGLVSHPDATASPIRSWPGGMRAGSVKQTMAGLVRDGSHKLSRWEAILPSMTSGSQGRHPDGNNDGIPHSAGTSATGST